MEILRTFKANTKQNAKEMLRIFEGVQNGIQIKSYGFLKGIQKQNTEGIQIYFSELQRKMQRERKGRI